MPPPEVTAVEALNARGVDLQASVLRVQSQAPQILFPNIVVATVDGQRAGLLEQRTHQGTMVWDTAANPGAYFGRAIVRAAPGFSIRIKAFQAYLLSDSVALFGSALAPNFVAPTTALVIGIGNASPRGIVEAESYAAGSPQALTLFGDPWVPVGPTDPPSAWMHVLGSTAAGERLDATLPPDGLVISNPIPQQADPQNSDNAFGIGVQWDAAGGGVGVTDRLVAQMIFTAARYGAYPPR